MKNGGQVQSHIARTGRGRRGSEAEQLSRCVGSVLFCGTDPAINPVGFAVFQVLELQMCYHACKVTMFT